MSPRLREAILRTAPAVAAQFRPGAATPELVAACLVEFDALRLEGFPDELAELRGLADPAGEVLNVLAVRGFTWA